MTDYAVVEDREPKEGAAAVRKETQCVPHVRR